MGPLCQVHIHSQQGSNCNRDSLLTGRWEAGGRLWIYSPGPGGRRAPADTGSIYQIFPSHIPRLPFFPSFFLFPVIPLPCFPSCLTPNMPLPFSLLHLSSSQSLLSSPSLSQFHPIDMWAISRGCDRYVMCLLQP